MCVYICRTDPVRPFISGQCFWLDVCLYLQDGPCASLHQWSVFLIRCVFIFTGRTLCVPSSAVRWLTAWRPRSSRCCTVCWPLLRRWRLTPGLRPLNRSASLFYRVNTEQNYPDCDLDSNLDREILLMWIAIKIILIQILGRLRCNNYWTMNNNVMRFVVLNNECPV